MKVKMRNFPGPRWIIVQQVQQQWSCCDQSPSGRLLVVEPDYLPDSYVFRSKKLYPNSEDSQKILFFFGGKPPKGKIANIVIS
jgi:hypothetical protein